MAKSKKSAPAKTVVTATTSKRAGYKRKSNKRVNVLQAQLSRLARKALKRASYLPKVVRDEEAKAKREFAEALSSKKPAQTKKKVVRKTTKA